MHFVFITGGVASSLGKGIASASLATLLKIRKFKVKIFLKNLTIKRKVRVERFI